MKSWEMVAAMSKDSVEKAVFDKFFVSVRPIQISYGDFFKLTPICVVLFVHSVVKGTFKLFLVFPCSILF